MLHGGSNEKLTLQVCGAYPQQHQHETSNARYSASSDRGNQVRARLPIHCIGSQSDSEYVTAAPVITILDKNPNNTTALIVPYRFFSESILKTDDTVWRNVRELWGSKSKKFTSGKMRLVVILNFLFATAIVNI